VGRDTWNSVGELKGFHSKPVSVVEFSPNGKYLASAGLTLFYLSAHKHTCKHTYTNTTTTEHNAYAQQHKPQKRNDHQARI